jgi:hypothetical protein
MVAFVVPIPIDHEESPFIFILTRNWFLILFTLSGLLFLAALIRAVSRRAKAVRETKSVNEKEVKEDGLEVSLRCFDTKTSIGKWNLLPAVMRLQKKSVPEIRAEFHAYSNKRIPSSAIQMYPIHWSTHEALY